MKLIDLKPKWFTSVDVDKTTVDSGSVNGITFLCPHCMEVRIGVAFHHAANEAMQGHPDVHISPIEGHIWNMSGNNFEDITLSPSVDTSKAGHWHGFVTNGEIK